MTENQDPNAGKGDDAGTQKPADNKETESTSNADADQLKKQNSKLIGELQSLRDKLKESTEKLSSIQKEKDEKEAEEAKKRGEFEKLFNEEKASREADRAAHQLALDGYKDRLVMSELRNVASREGVVDLDVVKLIPRDKITISDDLKIEGVEEAVKSFKASKASLFGKKEAQATGAAVRPNITGIGTPAEVKPGSKEAAEKLGEFAKKFSRK